MSDATASAPRAQSTSTPPAAAPPASQALVQVAPSGEIVHVGFDTVQGFEALQRIARMFASSALVPDAFKGNLPNCVIALEMAYRMKASPLMVMQNLYVVYGNPSWSSKFMIASFNQCGRFTAIRYRLTGERGKDTWGCVAWAKELSTGEIVEGPEVTIAIAKAEGWFDKKGSKWKTMPQLMLEYRAATFLIRTTAPELTMGLPSKEEAEDTIEAPNGGNGSLRELVGLDAPAAPAGDGAPNSTEPSEEEIAEAKAREAEEARAQRG